MLTMLILWSSKVLMTTRSMGHMVPTFHVPQGPQAPFLVFSGLEPNESLLSTSLVLISNTYFQQLPQLQKGGSSALLYMERWNHMAMDLVFICTFDNQRLSIGCVSKLGRLFGLPRHCRQEAFSLVLAIHHLGVWNKGVGSKSGTFESLSIVYKNKLETQWSSGGHWGSHMQQEQNGIALNT